MSDQAKNQHIFPQNNLVGFKFTNFSELLKMLNTQSQLKNAQQMSSWFFITGQDENHTYMKCLAVPTCGAHINSRYTPNEGFTVDEVNNKHNHNARDPKQAKIQQLKQHHILSPFIQGFVPAKNIKQIISGVYSVKINCCCKTNPGQTAIAYVITDPSGAISLRNCYKFEELTNNQAQFMAIMLGILECYANGIESAVIYSRSKLAIGFMTGMSKITAFNLKDIAEAARLLAARLQIQVEYRVTSQSSTLLQNVCRRSLGLKQIMNK